MRPSKAQFVTACQQLLALGAVLAVLTPAASVVSLDVVRERPSRGAQSQPAVELAAYAREAARPSRVPTDAVDAEVTEYPLTALAGEKAGLGLHARGKVGALPGRNEVVSLPVPVVGYGGVGVTWARGTEPAEDEIKLHVRTRTGTEWSTWSELPYHDDHGPDPDSEEAQTARPGTDVMLVGKVDQVQVRTRTRGSVPPPDLRLAVIAPGEPAATTRERPAIDAARLDAQDQPGAGVAARAGKVTPKPTIYSREQWGANEKLRDRGSLSYFEVHAGFVHHTVNANEYRRREVPGILRSIYAYHTQSRGWSDVGYNFLVDRFGRIWEGRAGGVDRPVVGAHTLGYNEYSFAMSAIGNFETARPSEAMLQAYGRLMAWKLSLHGVDATSAKQWVGSAYFPGINGHRDAGSTACPGRYLYAKLPKIRRLAGEAQQGWSGRELASDLALTPHPDLIVRRESDGQGYVIPTGGMTRFQKPMTVAGLWKGADSVVASPDLTGDGISDLVVRGDDGASEVRPGTGDGGVGEPIKRSRDFEGRDLITPVGDLDGDGNNDLVARNPENGRLHAFLGGGGGGFDIRGLPGDWSGYNRLVATGDLTGDGHVDLLARDTADRLWRYAGTGRLAFADRVEVSGSWGRYDTITGFGDYNRDGRGDLLARVREGKAVVLPARADGSFGHPLGPIRRLSRVAAISGGGQLLGDAAPDLVARDGDDLRVYANAGTFETTRAVPTGVNLANVNRVFNAGDWDRDGLGDIVTRRTRTGVLHLRRGDGDGHFGEAIRLARGFDDVRLLAAVGDMTGDGWPDLMGQPAGGSMRIYPGKGLSGLRASYPAHGRIDAGRQVPVGRWNADGAPDILFRKGGQLLLFPGNGPGGLTSPKSLPIDLGRYDWVVGVSDLNLTGHSDLVVRERSTGHLWALPATTEGFKKRRFLGEGMEQYDLVG